MSPRNQQIVARLGYIARENPDQFLRIMRDYSGHLKLMADDELLYQGYIELRVALGIG